MTIDTNSVALVTGASSGLGRSLAICLGALGASVALVARREDHLREVASEIRLRGGDPLPLACDVSDRTRLEEAVDATVQTFGRIDLLVNNAGIGAHAYVGQTPTEQLERVFSTNVFPLWYASGRALKYMRPRASGTILSIASLAGAIGYPANAHYVAAKHAVVGFTRALRAELAGSGITATVALPGGITTAWAEGTIGGPMNALFEHETRRGREIADALGAAALPNINLLSPDEVAHRIVVALADAPPEIYTHEGSLELVRLFQTDQAAAEARMEPYWLANLEYGRREGRLE